MIVQEADGGIVTDVAVDEARADARLLVPGVEHHVRLFGRAPRLVATDRGFYSGRGERRIIEMGVLRAVLPWPGYRSPKRVSYERQRWFRRGRAWRAGGEARISRLKHAFGMNRSRYSGRNGLDRSIRSGTRSPTTWWPSAATRARHRGQRAWAGGDRQNGRTRREVTTSGRRNAVVGPRQSRRRTHFCTAM